MGVQSASLDGRQPHTQVALLTPSERGSTSGAPVARACGSPTGSRIGTRCAGHPWSVARGMRERASSPFATDANVPLDCADSAGMESKDILGAENKRTLGLVVALLAELLKLLREKHVLT
jgi:hypothetical protein